MAYRVFRREERRCADEPEQHVNITYLEWNSCRRIDALQPRLVTIAVDIDRLEADFRCQYLPYLHKRLPFGTDALSCDAMNGLALRRPVGPTLPRLDQDASCSNR